MELHWIFKNCNFLILNKNDRTSFIWNSIRPYPCNIGWSFCSSLSAVQKRKSIWFIKTEISGKDFVTYFSFYFS